MSNDPLAKLEELERSIGEIDIKPDSISYNMYMYWKERTGGNRRGYQENFCHYCRVILFVTPWIWFWRQKIWKWVRPWMIGIPMLSICLFLGALWLWPEQTVTATLVILGVIGILAAAIGIALGIEWLKEHYPRATPIILMVVFSPLLLVVGALAVVVVYVVEPLYWKRRLLTAISWTVTIVGAIATGYWFLGEGMTPILITILKILALVLVVIVILVGIVAGFQTVRFKARTWGKRSHNRTVLPDNDPEFYNSSSPSQSPQRKGTNLLKLVWLYLVVFKRKLICPNIKLPEPTYIQETDHSYFD